MKLKINKFVTLMAIAGCFVSLTEAFLEDKILKFSEEMRPRMCHPIFGYPALDPFQIKEFNFSMDNKYVLDFSGSVADFLLTGFSNFNITGLKIDLNPLKKSNFNIVLPFTSVKSLYTAKGSLAHIIYLNGYGKAEGHVEDLKISVSWKFKSSLMAGIKNLKIEISIGNLYVDLENLVEDSKLNDFINALMNEMGIELLNDLWIEAQNKGFTTYIENTINTFLGNYSLSQIINIITAILDEPPFGDIPPDCKTHILT